jgi:(p)ppGpp synthase/HD superfamily hydrolase
MTATLEDAIALAVQAHRGQLSKDGEPYVLHPIRVMLACNSEEERIAAVLHDAVEDTDATLDDLRRAGFSGRVIDAVDSVTLREGEDYDAFIERCASNPIGRVVKLADIADNMNLERIPALTARDFERYQKYRRSRARLLQAEA